MMADAAGGKRVLVTGGAAGIGREIALAFMRSGATVHVCDSAADKLQQLVAEEPSISATEADVSSRSAMDRVFDDVRARLGGLDVLVNNAGMSGPNAAIEDVDPDEWE